MFAITAPTAVVLGLLSILLSVRVSLRRGRVGVALGDGGDMLLLERIRQHCNLAETAPMALILMGLAEAQGASVGWLYASAAVLLIARLIHPFGIRHNQPANALRIIGAVGTTIAMLISMAAIVFAA